MKPPLLTLAIPRFPLPLPSLRPGPPFPADRGYELDFRAARDSSLVLQKYGEYLYDAAIILAPEVSSFGGVVDVAAILDFVDSGHDLILAADSGASDTIRDIALECGVDLDENPKGVVIDHQQYARVSGRRDDHTLVLGSNLINSSVILGAAPIKGPVLFQGIAMTVSPTSELVVPVLSGSPTAYAADPAAALKEPPALQGKAVSLVAAMQARNNARVLISGSLALFTDSFFRAVVDVSATSADPASQNAKTSQWLSPAGNEQFVTELSKWTFHERGHLKAVNLRHNKAGESTEPAVYRVSDHLEFEVDIYEWAGSEWVPFKGDDVQVQFYMMSPYVLKTLSHDDKGRFFTSFQVPDVYGVFQFKVEHKRLGYSTISLAKQIPVRPFRHDEFERFIPAAFPYYASTFSMLVPADVAAAPASGGAGGGDLEAELAEIGAQLEAVAAVRDDLRAAVQRMDGLTRQLQSDLLGVHRRQEGAVQQAVQKARESVPKLQAAYAELAAIIARRPGEFYRFSDHWRSQNHTVVSQLAFAHWLDSGTLLSHKQLQEQLQLRASSFSIDLEDYLTGLCGLSNEFPRFVMNRVTAGDYAVPRVAAAFLNDLFAAFRKLNLHNDMLRKRFDGIKYDLKK
ncbi:unnamed protein product, partial [Closterium sp. Naga37s-1]